PDGRLLASGGGDGRGGPAGEVRLWDPTSGMQLAALSGHAGEVTALAFHPAGMVLASTGEGGAVRPGDGARPPRVASGRTRGAVRQLAFSPDGKVLITAHADGDVRLWDTAGWHERALLSGHRGSVWSVAFAPDGKRLLTTARDATLKLWSLEPRQL